MDSNSIVLKSNLEISKFSFASLKSHFSNFAITLLMVSLITSTTNFPTTVWDILCSLHAAPEPGVGPHIAIAYVVVASHIAAPQAILL